MADSHPLRRFGTRAALLSVGVVLGLMLAPRTVGAAPDAPPTNSGRPSVVFPEGVVDPASTTSTSTSTSTSTTSTSTSTSTTTPPTTTPPPTTPVTSALVPPLVVFNTPAQIGNALALSRVRVVARSPRTARPTAAVAQLPFTGNGTTSVLAAGLGALAIGALALWWGSRKRPTLGAQDRPTG